MSFWGVKLRPTERLVQLRSEAEPDDNTNGESDSSENQVTNHSNVEIPDIGQHGPLNTDTLNSSTDDNIKDSNKTDELGKPNMIPQNLSESRKYAFVKTDGQKCPLATSDRASTKPSVPTKPPVLTKPPVPTKPSVPIKPPVPTKPLVPTKHGTQPSMGKQKTGNSGTVANMFSANKNEKQIIKLKSAIVQCVQPERESATTRYSQQQQWGDINVNTNTKVKAVDSNDDNHSTLMTSSAQNTSTAANTVPDPPVSSLHSTSPQQPLTPISTATTSGTTQFIISTRQALTPKNTEVTPVSNESIISTQQLLTSITTEAITPGSTQSIIIPRQPLTPPLTEATPGSTHSTISPKQPLTLITTESTPGSTHPPISSQQTLTSKTTEATQDSTHYSIFPQPVTPITIKATQGSTHHAILPQPVTSIPTEAKPGLSTTRNIGDFSYLVEQRNINVPDATVVAQDSLTLIDKVPKEHNAVQLSNPALLQARNNSSAAQSIWQGHPNAVLRDDDMHRDRSNSNGENATNVTRSTFGIDTTNNIPRPMQVQTIEDTSDSETLISSPDYEQDQRADPASASFEKIYGMDNVQKTAEWVHEHSEDGNTKPNDMSGMLRYSEALRLTIHEFTQQKLDKELLDDLFSKGCLSQTEHESVSAKTTDTEKIRLLIVKIKDSSPVIIKRFLHILSEKAAWKHLYELVETALTEIKQSKDSNRAVCVICFMKAKVDIKDIADHLWRKHVIPDILYNEIVERDSIGKHRQYYWAEILQAFNNYKDTKVSISILKTALGSKYSHIGSLLGQLRANAPLKCCCCKRRYPRQRSIVQGRGGEETPNTTSTEQSGSDDSQSIESSIDDLSPDTNFG